MKRNSIIFRKSKKPKRLFYQRLGFFAGWTGLEPATLGVTGRYSKPTELPPRQPHFFKWDCKITKKI